MSYVSSWAASPKYDVEQKIKFSNEKLIDIWDWESKDFNNNLKPKFERLKELGFTGKVYVSWNWKINSNLDLSVYDFDIVFKSNIEIEINKEQDYIIWWFICDNTLNFWFYGSESKINTNVLLEKIHLNNTAFFYFDDFKLKLSLQDVINTGRCTFEWSWHSFSLNLSDTDLQYSIFNWVEFDSLCLENVNLTESIFNWCSFPEYLDVIPLMSPEKQKDNYRQLKHVMDKNWNHTEANKFYAKEMEYYWKSINISEFNIYSIFNKLHKKSYKWEVAKDFWEKLALNFSQNINEFGSNWIRPAFLLLLIAVAATIIEWISTLLWEKLSNNIFWDIWILLLLLWIILVDSKVTLFKNSGKKVDKIIDNIIWFLIITIIVFAGLEININSELFSSLQTFSNYLNPLWLLPEYAVNLSNWNKEYVVYNWLETFSFITYKIFYWIILWHLIVAAKRTTKR